MFLRIAAFAAAACLAAPSHAAPAAATAPVQPGLAAQLDRHFDAAGASGVFLFARGDDLLFHRSYGRLTEGGAPIPPDVVFPIGSVSKQFTAAAALQLAARGKLSLDDPLTRFFDGVPADKQAITVQQLLAHSSGLPRNVDEFNALQTREEFRARALAAPLEFEPGRHHRYSNTGYMLLAQIVERASGVDFDTYLDRNLFEPAGMTDSGFPGPRFAGAAIPSGYDRPKYGETYSGTPMDEPHALSGWYRRGAGGLLSTAPDLLRWARALEDGRILSPGWRAQMERPHGLITPDGRFRYGYGWVIQDSKTGPMLWHNGVWYSYYTEIRRFPELGLTAIGFTNRQQDETFDAAFRTAINRVRNAVAAP